MDNLSEPVADRLNSEPVIFRGSSSSELAMILVAAVAFWFPVSLLAAALFGAVAMGLGIAMVAILATVFVGSTMFQRIKRGRPDFYYQHWLLLALDRWGFRKTALIQHSGAWSLGRRID